MDGDETGLGVCPDVPGRQAGDSPFHALALVLRRTAFLTGQRYLDEMARGIADVLGVRYVVVGRFLDQGRRAETLVMVADGEVVPNMVYDLAGTPCERVQEKVCFFPRDVQASFPTDTVLVDMGVESYVGVPTFDGEGNPLGLVSVLHDRPFEPAEGQAIAELLSVLASAISSELDGQRIVQRLEESREQLVAASAAKSRFLANISHEIRTPLNGVIGSAALLEDSVLDAEQRQMVDTIGHCGQVLLSLIEDVLDLARIEAGELRLAMAPFCFDDLMRDLDMLFRVQAVQQGVAFDLHCEGGGLWLSGDRARLRQVLLNLVANALKFTDSGSVAVRARIEPRGARCAVCVEVLDSGCGIPATMRESIFRPFVQVDDGTTRRHGGAGLGLAISREIVAAMDGQIRCEPGPEGVGTRFTIDCELDIAAPPTPDVGSCADAVPGVSRARVLLVEDSPVNRLVAGKMLEKMGCEVTIARDGAEAVARFHPDRFDLVFMDCHLPVLDGLAATAAIRSAGHATPIVALTAQALVADQEACRNAGMDDFLSKPVTMAALRAMVQRWAPRAAASGSA